jgi:hypothetical protein
VEDGDQKPHSVPLQSSERIEEGATTGGLDKWPEGFATAGKPGQTGKTGEVVRGGVGIAEEAEHELYRPLVKGRVLETIGMGGCRHGETPETRNLSVRYRNAAADSSGEDRFTLEEASYYLLTGFNQLGVFEELAEGSEELGSLPDLRGNQHHRRIQLL